MTYAAAELTVTRTVPQSLECGPLVQWLYYLGSVSIELEESIRKFGGRRAGPLSWQPIRSEGDQITLEFRMRYVGVPSDAD
jgi:hypothetical protein